MATSFSWSRLPLLILFGMLSPLKSQQEPIKTSLCEAVAHETRFDGKRVRVHGKYAGTFEGTWLADSECNAIGEIVLPFDRQLQVGYGVEGVVTRLSKKFGIDDVVRDKSWEQFDSSSRRLYTGMTQPTAGCFDYVMADFDGVLIFKRNFRVQNGFGNGWGHLGGSRFLLILRSVSDVTPHPCAGIQGDSSPPTLTLPTQPPPDLLSPAKGPD